MAARRKLAAIAAGIVVVAALESTTLAEDSPPRDEGTQERYESPIVSLLFLPITLLVRIAGAIAPPPASPNAGADDKPAE